MLPPLTRNFQDDSFGFGFHPAESDLELFRTLATQVLELRAVLLLSWLAVTVAPDRIE